MPRATRLFLFVAAGFFAATALVYAPLFTGKVLASRDLFRLFIPDTSFLGDCLRAGEWPLWNPSQRLGQPFAGTLQSQAFYPPRMLLSVLTGPALAVTLETVLHVLLALFGTYFLGRTLRLSRMASAAAALLFALGQPLTSFSDEQNMLSSAAWSGVMLGLATRLRGRPSLPTAALLALTLGASLLAGSPEMVVWQVLLLLASALVRPGRRALFTGLSVTWGVVLASVALLPTLEFARHSTRMVLMVDRMDWPLPIAGLIGLGWPKAEYPREGFWAEGSEQWLIPRLYVGALAIALACTLLFLGRRRRPAWPFAAGAVFFSLLSLGSHFPPAAWLIEHTPLATFRYPVKYVVGAIFCLCVLAGFGVDRAALFVSRLKLERRHLLRLFEGLAVVVALAFTVLVTVPLRSGAAVGLAVPAVFLAAAMAIVWAGRHGPWRQRALRVKLGWLVLLLADLSLGRADLLTWQPRAVMEHPSALAARFPPFEGRISVTENLLNDVDDATYVATSRDALLPLRWVEERLSAVEGYGPPDPLEVTLALSKDSRAFFDLAGAELYVTPFHAPWPDLQALPDVSPELPHVYRAHTAMPRAFLVHRQHVGTHAEALRWVTDAAEPFRREAFVEAPLPLEAADCPTDHATITRSTPLAVDVTAEPCAPGVLVLTDWHYPGWEVTVDGVEAPLFVTDFFARGVLLPAGVHEVRYRYRPLSFALGGGLTLVALLAAVGVLLRRARAQAW